MESWHFFVNSAAVTPCGVSCLISECETEFGFICLQTMAATLVPHAMRDISATAIDADASAVALDEDVATLPWSVVPIRELVEGGGPQMVPSWALLPAGDERSPSAAAPCEAEDSPTPPASATE